MLEMGHVMRSIPISAKADGHTYIPYVVWSD